jgi:diguanylate cyclase (GGDEF)-like protein
MCAVITRSMMVLDGALVSPSLEAASGCMVFGAGGPLEAAKMLVDLKATLLVIHPDLTWHTAFVHLISPETRPAVVAVGGRISSVALVDEWISPTADVAEARVRFELASQRARERRRKNRQVFTDALTGLPNRRAVIRALTREAASSRRDSHEVALVLLDLDGFKQVNEQVGHDAGDAVLRKVGTAFRGATRGEELCGRIGGDEFALVMSGGLSEARRAAARLRESLLELEVSATAVAAVLESGEQLRHLYRRTDDLLRAAKTRRYARLRGITAARPPNRIASAAVEVPSAGL